MKAIVTVLGKDKKGIIAKVSTALYELETNIEDISQTILQDYFTMIMAVQIDNKTLSFAQIVEKLHQLGNELDVQINIQSQSIFDSMHTISTNTNKI
ncbi:MAG: ACT domain-containing protein [Clostridia bacterium]